MANINRPTGLSPVRNLGSSAWNGATTQYYIPSTDTNAYYIGDIVVPLAGVDSVQNCPYAVKAAASATDCVGVIVAMGVIPGQMTMTGLPATKTQGYYIAVCDDPNTVFEMTDDGITTANLVGTAVGKNCNFTVAAPSGNSPVSGTVINSSTIATTQALPLKIIGLKQTSNNSAAPYARWLVKFNEHAFVGPVAGV